MNNRHKGTVKWFNETKGFGFILPDDNRLNDGKDVFLHVTAVKGSGLRGVAEGDRLEFAMTESRGRQAATDLRALDGAPA